MNHGGIFINAKTAQIIRYASMVMPFTLTLYGLFVQNGIADANSYSGDVVFFSVMIPWMLLASWFFLFPSSNRILIGGALILTHLFAGIYVLLISGLATPFITGWILLFVASYVFFSRDGLRLSIVALVATGAASTVMHSESSMLIFNDIITVISLLIVGITALAVTRVQEVDSVELSRSKAQEILERDRILTIVNNLADAIMSTDENGIIRVYNAASLNLLDTNAGLIGSSVEKILTLYDQNNKKIELLKNLKSSKGVVVRDDITMMVGGEPMRLEVTYSPIRSGYSQSVTKDQEDGYILILRDITKAKSLEEERDEFISVVSHELRTPITITEGTISNVLLLMDRPHTAKEVLHKNVQVAHDQVIFLSKMVNDLSTLSRAERGVADDEELIDVNALIHDLYNEYTPQANAKGLTFNLDAEPKLGEVTASRLYLQELLQNFITNSIKYTKTGSVTLCARRTKNKITFEVKDTGIGISKIDQAKIFDKFYRSEDYRTRETGGTGLGLYVAMKLAKKLHTKIELTSRLNHGSSFSFDLKVKK